MLVHINVVVDNLAYSFMNIVLKHVNVLKRTYMFIERIIYLFN